MTDFDEDFRPDRWSDEAAEPDYLRLHREAYESTKNQREAQQPTVWPNPFERGERQTP